LRFIADGPALSDELLVARDEGRVLFFCGAGVSRANACLPGFLGLAEQVLDRLRALPDSAPRELISIANTLRERTVAGVGSILAADRLFGLLERDFAQEDINRAVGEVLRPPYQRRSDCSSHYAESQPHAKRTHPACYHQF
jgi:hypothetical protein